MDGILNPAFLQAACAKAHEEPVEPVVITLKALVEDPTITSVTSEGEITIDSIKSGAAYQKVENAMTAEPLPLHADDQTQLTVSAVGLVINTLGDQVELVTEASYETPEEQPEPEQQDGE